MSVTLTGQDVRLRPVTTQNNVELAGQNTQLCPGDVGQDVVLSVAQVFIGPAGTKLDGYAVSIQNPGVNDLVAFDGTKFINKPQAEVADGGNF